MKQVIIIKADTNDADYITEETLVTDPKQIEIVTKMARLLKEFKPYKSGTWTHSSNFPWNDNVREDLGAKPAEEIYKGLMPEEDLEYFKDMCPYGEYGIHTIESIRIITITEDTDLLK